MKIDANTRNWIIGGVVLIVLLVAAWWLFTKPASDTGAGATSTATTSQNTGTTSGSTSTGQTVGVNTGEEVNVEDQPAGDSVIVEHANISRASWLAVRDDMRIYGARRVDPTGDGQRFDAVSIPLLRNTEAGKTYTVVVYADDGDGTFDFKKDSLVSGLDDTFSALNGD